MAVTPYPSRYTSQPLDLTLSALADLVTAPNTAPYFTDLDQAALMTVSPLARSLFDDTTTAEMRATLEIPASSPPPTGTANTVAIFGSGGALTSDTELVYDATTNRLGVGLTPAWTLDLQMSHVVGATSASFYTARVVQNLLITTETPSPKGYALQVESNFADGGHEVNQFGSATVGINAIARFTSGFNIWTAIGVQSTVENTSNGSFQMGAAFLAAPPVNSGAGSISYYYGFRAMDSAVPSFMFGFSSQVSAGTFRYNFHAAGSAQNYFAGGVTLGNSTIAVNGTLRFDGTDFQGYKAGAWAPIGGGGDVTPGSVFLHMGA